MPYQGPLMILLLTFPTYLSSSTTALPGHNKSPITSFISCISSASSSSSLPWPNPTRSRSRRQQRAVFHVLTREPPKSPIYNLFSSIVVVVVVAMSLQLYTRAGAWTRQRGIIYIANSSSSSNVGSRRAKKSSTRLDFAPINEKRGGRGR